jgi:pantoate--beta-alanine ligase
MSRATGSGLSIVRTVDGLRRLVGGWRRSGLAVGLVPTMGSLHDGHLALVTRALKEQDRAVATLFVNPKQFERADDLAAYPRDEARDAGLLNRANCDALFSPAAAEMYPPGFATTVSQSGLAERLEGVHRPGHFAGVCTVVAKLLLQAGADAAYFGEKDYQQFRVVERMARDLDIPTEIRAVATVREPDGLALSSRNVRLSPAERQVAPCLAAELMAQSQTIAAGAEAPPLLDAAKARLVAAGFGPIDYLELAAADDLAPLVRAERPARLLAAAWLGRTRLIDNIAVPPA